MLKKTIQSDFVTNMQGVAGSAPLIYAANKQNETANAVAKEKKPHQKPRVGRETLAIFTTFPL